MRACPEVQSLESLVKEFPNLTCLEVMNIREEQKKVVELWFKERDSENLSMVDTLNKKGLWLKGFFGRSQRYVKHISNFSLNKDGEILCDVSGVTFYQERNKSNVDISIDITCGSLYRMETVKSDEITKEEYMKIYNFAKTTLEFTSENFDF